MTQGCFQGKLILYATTPFARQEKRKWEYEASRHHRRRPAGLTAAKELLAGNEPYDITILEESSEIGGISRTVRYEGNRMDIGGHRFFSKSDEIMQRWAQWMPLQGAPSFDDARLGREKPLAQGGPDPEKEDRVMLVRDRVSRIYYGNHFFDYPISMKWETIRNMALPPR